MDNISVQNAQGEAININVIRYFRLNESEYLIFSLNEVDEGGYVKLYICKIAGMSATSITDDVEWNLIKDTIKTIIKSNKDNLPLPIVDIDSSKLNGIQIVDQKVFKLSETFINLLGANKKVEPVIEEQSVQQIETNEIHLEDSVPGQNPITDDIPAMEATPTETPVTGYEVPVENNELPQVDQNADQISDPSIPDGMNEYALDYKTLYENELNKNKDLVEQNQKYQNIIDNLKKIIEEAS